MQTGTLTAVLGLALAASVAGWVLLHADPERGPSEPPVEPSTEAPETAEVVPAPSDEPPPFTPGPPPGAAPAPPLPVSEAPRKVDLDTALQERWRSVRASNQFSPEWWEHKYHTIEIQFRMQEQLRADGDARAANRKLKLVQGLLENLRLITPQLGGDESAARFANLAGRAGLTAGWEQYR